MYADKNDTDFNDLSLWSVSKNSFKNGEANLNIRFNIYKNYSQPISIKEVNFTEANVSTNLAKLQINENLNKSFRFYYARLIPEDINLLNTKDGSSILKIAVYDNNGYFNSNQILLDWYLDKNYSLNGVKVLGIESGYIYDEHNISDFNVILTKINYEYNLSVDNNSNFNFAVIHLKTPTYLWYSRYKDYNDSNNSGCVSHYCVEYHTTNTDNVYKVGSGLFGGSEVNTTHKIIKRKRGVRLYR